MLQPCIEKWWTECVALFHNPLNFKLLSPRTCCCVTGNHNWQLKTPHLARKRQNYAQAKQACTRSGAHQSKHSSLVPLRWTAVHSIRMHVSADRDVLGPACSCLRIWAAHFADAEVLSARQTQACGPVDGTHAWCVGVFYNFVLCAQARILLTPGHTCTSAGTHLCRRRRSRIKESIALNLYSHMQRSRTIRTPACCSGAHAHTNPLQYQAAWATSARVVHFTNTCKFTEQKNSDLSRVWSHADICAFTWRVPCVRQIQTASRPDVVQRQPASYYVGLGMLEEPNVVAVVAVDAS